MVDQQPDRSQHGVEKAADRWRPCPLSATPKLRLDLGPQRHAPRCRPAVVLFPRIVPRADSELVALDPAEALLRLLRQSHLVTLEPELAARHLEGLILARVVRPPGPTRPDRRPWLRRLLRPRRPPRPRPLGPLEPAVWGVIESCWVEEPSWRQGIGRQLVASAERWLRDQGAQRLRLGVAARNEEAQEFWQKLGFRPYRLRYLREL